MLHEHFQRSIDDSLSFLRRLLASEVETRTAIRVAGSLLLQKTRLRYLSGNLEIGGHLLLAGCQRFRGFDSNSLSVAGDLWIGGASPVRQWLGDEVSLEHRFGKRVAQFLSRASTDTQCPFATWPDNVDVEGDIHLINCRRLETLPNSFRCGQNLEIVNCAIQSLPDNMTVFGDLTIVGCPLVKLPENLRVEGNLQLASLPLEELPASLSVGGSLKITRCQRLRAIGVGVSIGKSLHVARSGLTHLASELELPDRLSLQSCPIETLTLPRCSNLSVEACDSLVELKPACRVHHFTDFRIARCDSLESLPDGLLIRGHCQLTNLPKLKRLPVQFQCATPIEIEGTDLHGLTELQMTNTRFRYRSVPIPAYALFDPSRISLDDVLNQDNSEVRRMMLERMGIGRFEEHAERFVVDRDTDAGGPRSLIRFSTRAYLFCRCPSTGRNYLLGVPTHLRRCHAAAAWLAGFENPDDYKPMVET
ncbi:MAG: hypothetical protein AAFX06_25140 [Planctomycetota bacterium]